MKAAQARAILYVRLPGLLSQAARLSQTQTTASPFVVAEGRLVRDACPLALAQGVRVGMGIVQARRLYPPLLSRPQEEIDAKAFSTRLWDVLADLSPVVEPEGTDAGYADITGLVPETVQRDLCQKILAGFGLMPMIGTGCSRLAARACAECGLPADRLADASVNWLWPEDKAILGRLQRLGLSSFGAVAAVSEESLRLHVGKSAPILHRRAQGIDLTPVRSLYPPPTVQVRRRFDDAIDTQTRLDAVLTQMSAIAELELRFLGGHGRRVVLTVQTECGDHCQVWIVPTPVSTAEDVRLAAGRLLAQMRMTAPVIGFGIDVADISSPAAHTPGLFCPGPGADPVALEAVRRRLAARFGLTTLTTPSHWPQTARQKRHAALRAQRQGAFL